MGYYERQDIPFHFALAETFTLCDAYHCSLLGPTWPNRMYLMTGMIDPRGTGGGPVTSNVVPSPITGKPYTWTDLPGTPDQGRHQVARLPGGGRLRDQRARVVRELTRPQRPASPLYENALTIYTPDRFEWDAKHDKLPTVSWIVPTSGQSEHPAYLPASGANFLASKLNAVAENRDLWSKTVFIVNYDENDGLFDHVVSPLPPAGTAGEFVQVTGSPNWPIGGGIRVPCLMISPWSVGGYVATEQFDHTSVLQFLERLTGVIETNITQWRRQTFGDLTSALGFSNGKATTFPHTLPNTIGVGSPRTGSWCPSGEAPPARRDFQHVNVRARLRGQRRHDQPVRDRGDARRQEVWVTESGTNTVSVITTSTNKITGTVVVGIYPHGIAITPDGKTAYVANTGPNTGPGGSYVVSVVDVASQTVTGTVNVGEAPERLGNPHGV